jgi:hypothetical protein
VTRLSDLARDENGQVTAFVVVIATAVLMFAGLLLDGGQALAAKVRAIGEAQEAARAGAQAIDLAAYRATGALTLTPDHAVTLAQRYLAATGHAGTVRVTGNTVTVTVTLTQPTQLLQLVGVGSLTVTSTGSAQPQRGITAPEP